MDFLAVGGLLIDRLRATVPDVTGIYSEADLATIRDQYAQLSPALFVLYGGYQPLESRSDGATRIRQHWLVVVSVREAAAGIGGATTQAGPLLTAVWEALLGWRPAPAASALLAEPAPAAQHEGGLSSFPLAFSTQLVLRGNHDG